MITTSLPCFLPPSMNHTFTRVLFLSMCIAFGGLLELTRSSLPDNLEEHEGQMYDMEGEMEGDIIDLDAVDLAVRRPLVVTLARGFGDQHHWQTLDGGLVAMARDQKVGMVATLLGAMRSVGGWWPWLETKSWRWWPHRSTA